MKRAKLYIICLLTMGLIITSASSLIASTFSGTVTYQDKGYDPDNGYNGTNNFLPIRHAEVEIVNAGTNETLASGSTDALGNYSLTLSDQGNISLFIRVYARHYETKFKLRVMNNYYDQELYTVKNTSTSYDTGQDQTIDLTITVNDSPDGAFNIYDTALHTLEFVSTLSTSIALDTLTLYWESGSDGTYYDRATSSLYLLGKSSDSDEFDDDIIMHEIGHFIIDALSLDNSPGGNHSLTDSYDLRLAWSEGIAHWFSSAVRRWVNIQSGYTLYTYYYYQIDTFSNSYSAFEIETPSFLEYLSSAGNELVVASLIWDISDRDDDNDASPTTDDDSINIDLAQRNAVIWDILTNYIPTQTSICLEDFWVGLITSYPTYEIPFLNLMHSYQIYYNLDLTEDNNSFDTAIAATIPSDISNLTFYKSTSPYNNDYDWFYFTANENDGFHFLTYALNNKCDTVLELYDTDGTTLLEVNDDISYGDQASEIYWTAPAGGTYYINIHPYNAGDAIVDFGDYSFLIEKTLSETANQPPTLTLTASSSTALAPAEITFTASASDTDGSITLYEWDFDNDGFYEIRSASSSVIKQTFSSAGTFTVSVKVTDDDGDYSTASTDIEITADSAMGDTIINSGSSTDVPLEIQFSANVTSSIGILYYEWDFDGDSVFDYISTTTPDITYTYGIPGTYIPILKVMDTTGVTSSFTGSEVTVTGSVPSITLSTISGVTSGSLPLTVNFIGTISDSTVSISSCYWDIDGDGSTEYITTSPELTHTYTAEGEYTAELKVNFTNGLSSIQTLGITTVQSSNYSWITYPSDGSIISGDNLVLQSAISTITTSPEVYYQYRLTPTSSWSDAETAVTANGTLYTGSLINISSLNDNDVIYIRSILNEVYPSQEITVTKSDASSTILNSTNRVRETFSFTHSTKAILDEGSVVEFPVDGIEDSGAPITIDFSYTNENEGVSYLKDYILFKKYSLSLTGTSATPSKKIIYKFTFNDEDNDGIIDGTNLETSSILVYMISGSSSSQKVYEATLNTGDNYISFKSPFLGEFELIALEGESTTKSKNNSSGCFIKRLFN